jgi:hypothetical protein
VESAVRYAELLGDESPVRAVEDYLDTLGVPDRMRPAVAAFALERLSRNELPGVEGASPWAPAALGRTVEHLPSA